MNVSLDLLAAMNNLCSGSEIKILLVVLECESMTLTTSQMLKLTGITKPNNYFRTRKQLINLGYLIIKDDHMSVNYYKILKDYEKLSS